MLAAIVTAILLAGTFQPADASFDPCSKTQGGFEPPLRFAAFPPTVLRTWLGQRHLLYAQSTRQALIRFREHATIGSREIRSTLEQSPMVLQTRTPLNIVRRIAPENPILRDDPTVHFTVPELASEFGLARWRLAPLDNRGVRFKQTDDLFGRRHRLMLEDPPRRLLNHRTHQRHIMGEEVRQCCRTLARAVA